MLVTIKYTLPASRLDHNEDVYLAYDPTAAPRPTEDLLVPARDIRSDLDSDEPVAVQLATRGFAVARHATELLPGLVTAEGAEEYMREAAEILRRELGCTRVVPWNSVSRRSDPSVSVKIVEQQKEPEKGHIPGKRQQPPATMAHVDQDATWGKELASRAIKEPVDNFKRVQIVNIWRPLAGPVTNSPLAMLDFRLTSPEDLSRFGNMFGTGMDVHYSDKHEWSYIRHQQSDEIIFLKCYDSWQGSDESALYCAHVAAVVDDSVGIAPENIFPRESIEVRLVAVWE